jgi:hypothetical protein
VLALQPANASRGNLAFFDRRQIELLRFALLDEFFERGSRRRSGSWRADLGIGIWDLGFGRRRSLRRLLTSDL